MTKIEFTDAEIEVVRRLLTGQVRELSYEIADTDTSRFRDEIRLHRENVQTVLDKFGGLWEDEQG